MLEILLTCVVALMVGLTVAALCVLMLEWANRK